MLELLNPFVMHPIYVFPGNQTCIHWINYIKISGNGSRASYMVHSNIHNTKGILVSRSGFTGGVYDFVCGKPIELLNLNQLLELNSQ